MVIFIIGILFDTVSRFLKWGAIHEQIALLVFGISLFCLPAGLRFLSNRRTKKAARTFKELNKRVIVENG